MKIKNGPYFSAYGLRPEIVHAENTIIEVYRIYGRSVTWTSGADRAHTKASLHYAGQALDVWWNDDDWTPGEGESVADEIRNNLGRDYDVVKEENHIHVEYQPKSGVNL